MIEVSLLSLSPFLLLLVSVIFSLTSSQKKASAVFLVLSLLFAFLSQQMMWPGAILFVALPLTLFLWINHYFAEALRKLGFLVFLILSFLLLTHYMAAVPSLKIFDQLLFAKGSAPFDLYLNYDKVYLAVVLFLMLPRLERQVKLRNSVPTILKYYVIAVALLLPLALLLSYVKWEVHNNPYILIWVVNNFFFVAFAEEVIFRRYVQTGLLHYFRSTQYGDFLAIFGAALLFGLTHWAGGFTYVLLASLAGVFYGFCFYQTSNVRSALFLHFMVNLTHALFFTYPYAV